MATKISISLLVLGCFYLFGTSEAAPKLSAGAQACFKKNIAGVMRRVKLGTCAETDRITGAGGFPFEDLEIRIGNVLFNTDPKVQRTILVKDTTVQICMYGKLDTNRLRGNVPVLQVSAHGKPTKLGIGGIGVPVPVGVVTDFCDIKSDGCKTTEPSCDQRGKGGGVQDFCSCSTLKVPDYAPTGTEVEVTWKLLEAEPGSDATQCESESDMDKLWRNKKTETLACIKLDAKIKECSELGAVKSKIDGC